VGEYVIPSEDGAELYHFDALGRHQETFDGWSYLGSVDG
jgi:hypothetical protein